MFYYYLCSSFLERVIERVLFNRKETEDLKALAGDFHQAEVYDSGTVHVNTNLRNSFKYPFKDNSVFKHLLIPKLSQLGIKDIGYESMLLKYTKGHYFKRHSDRHSNPGKRQKTLVIQLSDSNEYEGGYLKVGDKACSKELGNVILFDAASMHEVTKINLGIRYCFLAFLENSDLKKSVTLY